MMEDSGEEGKDAEGKIGIVHMEDLFDFENQKKRKIKEEWRRKKEEEKKREMAEVMAEEQKGNDMMIDVSKEDRADFTFKFPFSAETSIDRKILDSQSLKIEETYKGHLSNSISFNEKSSSIWVLFEKYPKEVSSCLGVAKLFVERIDK